MLYVQAPQRSGDANRPQRGRRNPVARNFIVYQSRNRLTGTLTQTLDTRHAESDIPFNVKKGRYAARCVEHKTTVFFQEHYHAGRAIAHVDEWCKKCQGMIAKGTKVNTTRTMRTRHEPGATVQDDLRMAPNNNAHGKRWREGAARRDVSKETERKEDQTAIHPLGKRTSSRKDNTQRQRRASTSRKAGEVVVTRPAAEMPVVETPASEEPVTA